jgi:hypothetical protein
MKVELKDIIFKVFVPILTLVIGLYGGYIASFRVQKYAIEEHERLKSIEKEALKQKIERENQILIRRLEEDFQAFKDSVIGASARQRKQFMQERGGLSGPGSSVKKEAIEQRFVTEANTLIAAKRKEIDRKIEDLKMRLDF